ncbi:phostensin [Xenopus laevis]|uniref:Phostensin/Taperin PP1-binding domain-containing protein n=2 Tax=Xenopus laevis TaxID=8355 RepID=A0A974H647_XENLA|nr:phostensin [Xenopus laevis]OCT66227.1 hypothetical protein XELAEV_18042485mg [Xenopus laevis]
MMEVPDWKVHLLERRRKEEDELKKRESEEEERLAKMPAWKREIILRRKAKAEATVLAIKAEVDGGEQEESTKMASGVQEEKEVCVLSEKIGPVQQNPFIQQEKQRRMPVYSCLRKTLPETPVSRTVRTDDMVRGLNGTHMEEEQKAPKEDINSTPDEGTGIVSRLLSRFGRSWSEGENGGSSVPLVNGELEMMSKTLCSDTVKSDSQASAMLAQQPPSPSCHRAATGNQTSTQETSHSSLTPPYTSTSCTESEIDVLSPCMASMAKSGLCAKLSINEEAKPFPFQLRPSSPASSRQIKQTIQSSVAPNRPEVSKHGTGQVKEDGEGGTAHNKVICSPFGNKQGTIESQAMQRRKGNTITVNPRKMAGCENGFVATETRAPVPKTDSGKKRYPTVDEIKVIGGYQAIGRSCLAKHSHDKKKLNISFPDSELESTFEYPSESSLLAEFGPPDEPETFASPAPQTEDDEEEDIVLLGGILRRKALIVDESCKR